MRFRSLEKWEVSPEIEGLIFFAQRAEELLFDYTVDSYKPMSLNAPFLCEEALSVIGDIKKELLDKANLRPILEELSWSLKHDMVAKSLLDLPYESYILSEENSSIEEIEIKLSVLRRTLDSYRYIDECLDLLYIAIENKKKKDIDSIARLLFTNLINQGMSKSYLSKKTLDFFFVGNAPQKITNCEAFKDYVDAIYPKSHKFEMYFWVSGLIDVVSESTEAFGIEVLDELPEEVAGKLPKSKTDIPSITYKKIAKVSGFRALDWYSAKEIAEKKLSRLRDLYNLYHHKSKIEWDDKVVVVQCCEDEPRTLGVLNSPIEKIEDERPEQASRKLNRLLKNINLSRGSFEKFNRAVDFHSLSANTRDVENQLLNLWIGLETITPTHSGHAKITQICNGIMPFLSIMYTKRLIGVFTKDLLRWDRRTVNRILKKIPVPKGAKTIDKVSVLLCCPKCDDLRAELYSDLKDFHLLRFRAFTLHEKLSSPEKVVALLAEHEKKVLWQIRRIYRSRNLLVHSGRTLQYLPSLVENAHDYFDQVIFIFIRMCIGTYSVKTIGQSFELAKLTRTGLNKKLKDIKVFDSNSALILVNDYSFMQL
ncbi:hypothetical protein CXF85_02840 [Colwellia sp. 75C3]|uniref:hypothetical protein n=1 Tax=Colwellia sp. 75C3 TaxID=888425 RepID=UPI000C321D65|nr:hypothetical protein [Colwellia sp. 75C3]PKG85743.1 hypothetical protein CXF85_02840 [Colwellia sp. 75C3]